jgi:hypothetical protein
VTTMARNGSACSTGWYRSAPVNATFTASTPSDQAVTKYTTDGSDPTISHTLTAVASEVAANPLTRSPPNTATVTK